MDTYASKGRGPRTEGRGEEETESLEPRTSSLEPAKHAIGVFGGTFDPVHNGHLRIALDAREALGLAEVRLIPLAQAVHREQPETSVALRLKMLRAAIAGRPGLVADDRELLRKGPSYSIDTLKSLRHDFPDSSLCLLLGDDAFSSFADWRDPQGILTIANIAVLQRPGQPLPHVSTLEQILSRHQVKRFDWSQTGQILFCPVTQLDIASSDIRRRVASGRSVDFLVPAPVLDLIGRHGLYG